MKTFSFLLALLGLATIAPAHAQVESGFGGAHVGMVVQSKDNFSVAAGLAGVDYMFLQSRGEMSIVSFAGLGVGITTQGDLAPELIPLQFGNNTVRGGLSLIPPMGGRTSWTGGVILGIPFGNW